MKKEEEYQSVCLNGGIVVDKLNFTKSTMRLLCLSFPDHLCLNIGLDNVYNCRYVSHTFTDVSVSVVSSLPNTLWQQLIKTSDNFWDVTTPGKKTFRFSNASVIVSGNGKYLTRV